MPATRCLVASALGADAAGPCPPAWFHPPRADGRALAVCAAVLSVYLVCAAALSALCDAAGFSDGQHGGVLSLYLHLACLCTFGYVLVSLHLRRPLAHSLCSRYGGCGECHKLHLIVPWLMLTGLMFVLRSKTDGERKQAAFHSTPQLLFPESPEEGLQLLSSLPLSFVLSFFFGAHFTFLDGSAVLQSLGCKLPLPSLWPELHAQEIAIIVGAGLALLASLTPSLLYLARDESPLALLLSLLVLSAVIVYLADMRHMGSGVIVGSAGGGGGGGATAGLEAPMSGRAMWRTKIAQILGSAAATHPPPAASNSPRSVAYSSQLVGAVSIAPESVSLLASSSSSVVPVPVPAPQIFLHVHHYLWGLLMLPLLRFPSFSCLVAAGAMLGVSVEGIACWGMDPLLVCKRPIEPKRNQPAQAQPGANGVGSQSTAASSSPPAPLLPVSSVGIHPAVL